MEWTGYVPRLTSMTQILPPLDLLPSIPGHTGSLAPNGGPRPMATARGRTQAPAEDPAGPAFMRDPQLAPRLLRLAERSGLLPAPSQDVRRLSSVALRALQAPGQSEESLLKLEAIKTRRDRNYLQALAVQDGLLPKPVFARNPSPLGPHAERRTSPPRAPVERVDTSPARRLGHEALTKKIAALVKATPGEAARSLVNADFEAALRRHAANEGKLLFLSSFGLRYVLVTVTDPAGPAAAQARHDRNDRDDLVTRYQLIPHAAAQTPTLVAENALNRFNTYAVVNNDVAQRLYTLQELEGGKGLATALALSFDPARATEAAKLRRLLVSEGALPRLVAKKPAIPGVRARLSGHHPVVLYTDTPQTRAYFAAQDAAEARSTRLRLHLDTGNFAHEENMRPMLGFAQQV